MMKQKPVRILFICMGNICRSPLAEGVFIHHARKRGVLDRFEVDSAGTGGWHAGNPPDHRMLAVARRFEVPLESCARQVTKRDFETFDLILCMDEENREELLARGAPAEKTKLLLECDPNATLLEVPDPYYGGEDGFELVYRLVDSACRALLDDLVRQESSTSASHTS